MNRTKSRMHPGDILVNTAGHANMDGPPAMHGGVYWIALPRQVEPIPRRRRRIPMASPSRAPATIVYTCKQAP